MVVELALLADNKHAWRRIGHVDDFLPGMCRILTIGKHEVGVYNIDGDFYAIRNYCPHMGAPICKGNIGGTMLPSGVGEYVYGLEGSVLHCPWHQWAFDIRTGRALFGIDRSRLICHTVSRKGDELFIDERIRKQLGEDADALTAESASAESDGGELGTDAVPGEATAR